MGLGAVVVALNPLSPAPELETEIAAVGAKVVVIEKLSAGTWANVDRSQVPTVVTVISSEHGSGPEGTQSVDELLRADPAPVACEKFNAARSSRRLRCARVRRCSLIRPIRSGPRSGRLRAL